MGVLALILGILGGLCAVMAILTAVGIVLILPASFTAIFWLGLAGVLLLATIASLLARTPYE
ncbi:MAG: hypothetical protein E3J67_02165 [Dehalococcoidia bacterium]|nr:MAG: hypothetical protein E3J67_02165 [Dehalococcoidia bacterium]